MTEGVKPREDRLFQGASVKLQRLSDGAFKREAFPIKAISGGSLKGANERTLKFHARGFAGHACGEAV